MKSSVASRTTSASRLIWLAPVDRQLLAHLAAHFGPVPKALAAALAALGWLRDQGHPCLPLAELESLPIWPELATHFELDSAPVAAQLQHPAVGDLSKPLVLDADHLLLQRLYRYHEVVAAGILKRLEPVQDVTPIAAQPGLDSIQQEAAKRTAAGTLALISGGPGTGKSTLAATIIRQWLTMGVAPHRIQLAAPTGKAAARLEQALPSDLGQQIARPQTLHRLLGVSRRRPAQISARPDLPIDALLIDETSMVDLELMAATLSRLPPTARLVLLGDPEQLPSVGVGTIMADLCRSQRAKPALVELTRNYRFAAESALGQLAQAVRAGDADRVIGLLEGDHPELVWLPDPTPDIEALLDQVPRDWLALPTDAADAHACAERFRILCAQRQGPAGVESINQAIRAKLQAPSIGRFAGELMVATRNDYHHGIFNGDQAVVCDGEQGRLDAVFWSTDGARSLLAARLEGALSAWAMTVHRSQGSEYNDVLLILPAASSPLITRQLLYTGLTRARQRLTVVATEAALRQAVATHQSRYSILPELLDRG